MTRKGYHITVYQHTRGNTHTHTVGNKKKDTRNDIGKVDKSVTSQASRIAESKRSTYAEAVKKHDERFMKGINEHSSLKRNNPFLYHLTKLI